MIRIEDATWSELAAAVEAGCRTAIVPLGATEQHGPHLPCGTDTARAAALAGRVAEAWGEPVFVTPVIALGVSDEHGGFPGLVGVSAETFSAVLVDVATRLSWWGTTRVVFLNTHGGSVDALEAARARLAGTLPWLRIDVPRAGLPPADGVAPSVRGLHAGEGETSEMLAIDPDRVRMHAARRGLVADPADVLARLRAGPVRELAPSGVLGDPTRADRARGEARLEALVAVLVEALRR